MRKIFLIISLFIFSHSCALGQNLVINPSYEDTISCPPTDFYLFYCRPWYRALRSPDYFRENCNITGCCHPSPYFAVGYQLPHTGTSYMGLILYSAFENQAREFIGGKLADTLIGGHKYCVEFWVSPANVTRYVTDDIGIYFSLDSVIAPIVNPHINIVPQVEALQGFIISDTSTWTQVYGEFYALGGEQYLCIGNFKDDSLMTLDSINDSTYHTGSYYFIDDVSITDCTVGIEELDKINITVSPNPVADHLYLQIEMNLIRAMHLSIWSLFGKEMMQNNYKEGQKPYKIDVHEWPPGMYFLELTCGNMHAIAKFLKE